MSFESNEPTSYNDFLPAVEQVKSATVEALTTRQSEEVKAAIFMAKQFPRDQQAAFNRIMNACKRKKVAEEAEYEFPKGGGKVSGPSIRLAEVLAQNWGNMEVGLIEVEQKNGASQVMSFAWDLETNIRTQMTFTVRHERKAKGKTVHLDDPRDIYEMVANQGARRKRACILAVIPGDIVEAAVSQCRETLKAGHTEPLSDRIRKALQQFDEKYGVKQDMIEKYMGCNSDSFTENDYLRLGNVWRALKDGMAKREDYFDFKTSSDFQSESEKQFKQAQAAGSKAGDTGDSKQG
ncbi:hypothetical protein VE23_25035 [Paenibacillus sp. D9]|uniref:hypothetical protein n=1 Tax=Paenibacillus sp. D9 TaxID=665792 RepID=UPI0006201270|nr:hypothetical protein [Paenibacillus sp. D9]KKC49561.1 hypothetical protein VE23_25035 [Paenibacillus sp. D9]